MFTAALLLVSSAAASLGQAHASIPGSDSVEPSWTMAKDHVQFAKKSKKSKKAMLEIQIRSA
jgi:hypothetical protein